MDNIGAKKWNCLNDCFNIGLGDPNEIAVW